MVETGPDGARDQPPTQFALGFGRQAQLIHHIQKARAIVGVHRGEEVLRARRVAGFAAPQAAEVVGPDVPAGQQVTLPPSQADRPLGVEQPSFVLTEHLLGELSFSDVLARALNGDDGAGLVPYPRTFTAVPPHLTVGQDDADVLGDGLARLHQRRPRRFDAEPIGGMGMVENASEPQVVGGIEPEQGMRAFGPTQVAGANVELPAA